MNPREKNRSWIWRRPLLVWLALLILLAMTATGAYIPLGAGNIVLALGIAAIKAGLIIYFFMHLSEKGGAVRLAALTGLLFLGTMFLLIFGDYLNR